MAGALDNLLLQVYQMRGMFDDSDGKIAEAISEAERALRPPETKDYDVYVYHLVRTKLCGVTAVDPKEAAEDAIGQVCGMVPDIRLEWSGEIGGPEDTEDAEEIQGCLVTPSNSEESGDADIYFEFNAAGELEECQMRTYSEVRNGSMP